MIIKRKLRLHLLLTLALFVVGTIIAGEALAGSWFNEDWSYRKGITVNTGQVTGGPHVDFPMLVSISDTDLQNDAQPDGDDILFTASDGTTKLDHEIESYSSGTLVAWVRIPNPGISDGTVIYMYYGNGSVGSQENISGTWDSDYTAVWHLDESPANDTAGHLDSTSNNFNGTPKNFDGVSGSTTDATGQINGADEFDAVDDWIQTPPSIGALFNDFNTTVSVWFRPTGSSPQNSDVWNLHSIVVGNNGEIGIVRGKDLSTNEDRIWAFNWDDFGDAGLLDQVGVTYNVNQWIHITWVHTGGNLYIYKNGVESGSVASGPTSYSLEFKIGGSGGIGTGVYFSGRIDEIRISNVARSAGWIETSYNNQNAPSSFLTVSAQVSIPTMTEWGMIIFMVLAGLGSVYYLRRRRIES